MSNVYATSTLAFSFATLSKVAKLSGPPIYTSKSCPRCSTIVEVQEIVCGKCGHRFRTLIPPETVPRRSRAVFWVLLSAAVVLVIFGWCAFHRARSQSSFGQTDASTQFPTGVSGAIAAANPFLTEIVISGGTHGGSTFQDDALTRSEGPSLGTVPISEGTRGKVLGVQGQFVHIVVVGGYLNGHTGWVPKSDVLECPA